MNYYGDVISENSDVLTNKRDYSFDLVDVDGVKCEKYYIKNNSVLKKQEKYRGLYYNLDFRELQYDEVVNTISKIVYSLIGNIPRSQSILCVGTGNQNMITDSLGAVTMNELNSSHSGLLTLSPSVKGVTGISSYTVIKGVVGEVKPGALIIVDSLCGKKYERIGSVCQISNTGIVLGSALGCSNRISFSSFHIPVISVGVPTVIHSRFLFDNPEKVQNDLIVAPKDIDRIVNECACLIAGALSIFDKMR